MSQVRSQFRSQGQNFSFSRIGDLLLRRGQVRKFQLDFLLQLQRAYASHELRHVRIGDLLVEHRAVTPLELTEALAIQEALPKESVTQIVNRMNSDKSNEEVTIVYSNRPFPAPF